MNAADTGGQARTPARIRVTQAKPDGAAVVNAHPLVSDAPG
jgi:hypothetical protein